MTVTDGTITVTPQSWAQPLDEAVSDLLVTLDAEYFVEWQVADIAPLPIATPSREN